MDEVFGRLPTFGIEVQGFRSLRALVPIQTPPTATSTKMNNKSIFQSPGHPSPSSLMKRASK
jgi:hypothetical protein